MNVRAISPGAQQALRVAQLSDKAEGYPKRAQLASGGFHPRVAATYQGPGTPGWSSYENAVEGDSFTACNGSTWLLVNGAAPNLTAQERSELIALYTPARRFSTRFSVRFW